MKNFFLSILSFLILYSYANANTTPSIDNAIDSRGTFGDLLTPKVANLKVLLLKPWAGGGAEGWIELGSNWSDYGDTSLQISVFNDNITFQDLVASKADVIVLSDSAGGKFTFSTSEISAINKYVNAGHTLVGTYAVFGWKYSDELNFDNRSLGPLFGFKSGIEYATGKDYKISNFFQKTKKCKALNMAKHWKSVGYAYSQMPLNKSNWSKATLSHAKMVASSDDNRGIVSVYQNKNYSAIYFSNMPEVGKYKDTQLLYNALTFKNCSN